MFNTIGIAIQDHNPLGVKHVEAPGRHCTFVGQARQGRILWASGEDISCQLARFNLGLDQPDKKTIEALANTLVNWGDVENTAAARRFIAELSPLPFGERIFVYFPLEEMTVAPDLVLCILQPQEAFRHVLSITASTGELSGGRVGGIGALCGECTAVPLLNGDAAVSVGCEGSRREVLLASDELFLSIPYSLYRSTTGS